MQICIKIGSKQGKTFPVTCYFISQCVYNRWSYITNAHVKKWQRPNFASEAIEPAFDKNQVVFDSMVSGISAETIQQMEITQTYRSIRINFLQRGPNTTL